VIEPALDGFRYSGNMYMNTYLQVYIYIYIYVFTHQLCAYELICALWTPVIEPALGILMASVILVIRIYIYVYLYIYTYLYVFTRHSCAHIELYTFWTPVIEPTLGILLASFILALCISTHTDMDITCMYIYKHIHTYLHIIHIRTYICTHLQTGPVIQPELGILMASVNMAIGIHIHVHIYICTCTRIYVSHIYVHSYVCIVDTGGSACDEPLVL